MGAAFLLAILLLDVCVTGASAQTTVSPTSLSFGSVALGGASNPKNVTLKNTQTVPLNNIAASTSGDYAVTATTCGSTLLAGKSCTFSVVFQPVAIGTRNGTLTITHDASNSPQTVALTGTGTLPVLLTPTSLSFPATAVGSASASQSVTLKNNQRTPLTSLVVSVAGDFTQTNNCASTLNPGASCKVNVTFRPTAGGTRAGTLVFTNSAVTSPQTVPLAGTGTGVTVSVSPTGLAFGSQLQGTVSAAQNVLVTNTGSLGVTISSIATSGEFTQSNNCPATLAAATSCAVAVQFAPQSTGPKAGTLTINDNAEGAPQTVSLSGTGDSLAVSVTPGTLAFGNQLQNTTSPTQNVTLKNTGTLAVTISSISITGDFTQSNACPATLSPAASCNIAVAFAPASAGAKSGMLTISDNATGAPPTVSLSGNGTSKTLTLSNSNLLFGDQVAGTTSAGQNVVVTNTGTLGVTISGISISGEFHQTNDCPPSLAAGTSCTVTVSFAPVSAGSKSGTLTLSDDATGAPQTVGLAGNGLPVALSSIVITPAGARLLLNATQAFSATGIYNDNSTQDLTASATWSSSEAAVVSMAGNVATSLAPGTVTLSAQSGSITATATVIAKGAGSVATGDLLFPRGNHQAVRLNNGTVLILGGNSGSPPPVAPAELFDPATMQFQQTGSIITPRYAFSATRLQDGRVLVTGGNTSAAEIYDPADGLFHPTGNMSVARFQSAATLLNDGRVLVTGGYYDGYQWSDSAELYDPQSGTFSQVGPMVGRRREHTSTLLPDGRVLIVGGDQTTPDGTAEIFDPIALSFTATGSMPVNRFGHTATLLNDGRVLIAGGYGAELLPVAAFLYDPASGTFVPTGSLATSRYGHTATLLNDGRVMIAGGFAWWFATGSVEIFDPATETFTMSRELLSRRGFIPATMLNTGEVLFTGGDIYSGDPGSSSGPSGSGEVYSGSTQLMSVQITPADTHLAVGQSLRYGLVGTFADGTTQPLTGLAEWTSSDPNVVSLDAHLAIATANAPGTVTVTVQLGGFSAATSATVP